MGTFDRHLLEEVTHWPVTGSNGYGGFTFGTPVILMGRWEHKTTLYRADDTTQEKISNARVFLNSDVAEGDYIALGDYTDTADPTTLPGVAYRVAQYRRNADLRNLQNVRTALL